MATLSILLEVEDIAVGNLLIAIRNIPGVEPGIKTISLSTGGPQPAVPRQHGVGPNAKELITASLVKAKGGPLNLGDLHRETRLSRTSLYESLTKLSLDEVVKHGEDKGAWQLMVLADDIPLPGMQFEPSVVFPGKMTAADVETLLDISPGDIPSLLEQGYLERRGRYLDGQSVRRLATKYISNVCLARRLNHAVRSMKRFMASHRVLPSIIYSPAHQAPSYLLRMTKVATTFPL